MIEENMIAILQNNRPGVHLQNTSIANDEIEAQLGPSSILIPQQQSTDIHEESQPQQQVGTSGGLGLNPTEIQRSGQEATLGRGRSQTGMLGKRSSQEHDENDADDNERTEGILQRKERRRMRYPEPKTTDRQGERSDDFTTAFIERYEKITLEFDDDSPPVTYSMLKIHRIICNHKKNN